MNFKETDNLIELARLAGKTENEAFGWGCELMKKVLDNGFIDEDSDSYGRTLEDAITYWENKPKVADVCRVLNEMGIQRITDEIWDKYMNLVCMGDGDCPECGGDMEITSDDWRVDDTGMPYNPYMKCNYCGHTEKY